MEEQFLQQEEVRPPTESLNLLAPRQSLTENAQDNGERAAVVIRQATDVQSVLRQEAQDFRRHTWRAILGLCLFTLLAGCVFKRYAETFLASPAFVLGFVSLLFLPALLSLPSDRKRRRRRRHLTANVAEQYDIGSIGPLIDALQLDDIPTREIALDALTLLLPRLQASDTGLLNDAQRAKLCHILSLPVENPLYKDVRHLFGPAKNRAIDVRVAILQAFEQVGDQKALPVVQRLATREARTVGEKRIQEAAQQCLPALQLRAEEQRSSQTLLRAADISSTATETLLRAATGAPEGQAEQLLRPSS